MGWSGVYSARSLDSEVNMNDIDSDACTRAQKGENNEQQSHSFDCGDMERST